MTSLDFVMTGTAFCHLPHASVGYMSIEGPFLIPIAGMAFVLGIILIGALEKAHKDKLRHETIQRALDKGQPLPPELIEGKPLPSEFFALFARKARDDRRGGLIAIAVGVGLFVFFGAMRAEGVPDGLKWLGLIPGLVGVALLINWALERGEKNGQDKP
jgi:hypothetical protein